MTFSRFDRYELRTTDVDGARAFYREIFGDSFWSTGVDAASLPAPALARGAHARNRRTDGRDTAGVVLRDPFGANVALMPGTAAPNHHRVAWHLHGSRDEERAIELYAGVLGWTALERQDLGERGRHVTFSWNGTGRPVGSTSDIARRPHVHAQWLYFFRTPNLEAALARVRDLGALPLPPTTTADGHRVAACDDPQGGAFGLYEDATADDQRAGPATSE